MKTKSTSTYSPVQLKAIQSKGENLLVSASAGSGKTTVMIGRILNLIDKEDASLDKMLICTFTRASAQDMKEKLYKKLIEKRNQNAEREKFDRQISLIPLADISTIDAWCIKIVRNYFYAIDVDPAFEIMDETESKAMLMQAVERVLDEFLSKENNDAFLVLYESMYKHRSDREFKKLICKIYEFVMTQANPEQWLQNSLRLYDGSYDEIRDALYESIERSYLAECDELINNLASLGCEKALTSMQKVATALISGEDIPNLTYANVDTFTQSKMKKLREKIKKFADKKSIKESVAIDTTYAEQIVAFTLAVKKAFDEEKTKKAVMDFSDCEHKAYQILEREDLLASIREKYSYVFVDEYQDVNPLQDAIINKLKKDGNMFFVGDIKQSIYGFRNCDPAIFANLYDNYSSYDFAKPIDFVTNYRCGQRIIDFVNSVFCPLMTKDFGGVDYLSHQLEGYEKTIEGEVRATVYKPSKNTDYVDCDYDLNQNQDAGNADKLAEIILNDIVKNLDKIKKDGNKATFSDVAILTPKRNELAYTLYEKMKRLDIPVHMTQELYFSSNPTVRYILDILTFINDNENDVAFVSVVTTPYFNLTASDIIKLCKNRKREYSLSSYARWYAKVKTDELSQKLTHVFEFFDKYSELSMYMSVKDTVSAIIVETDYFDYVLNSKGAKEADVLAFYLETLNSCPQADTIEGYLRYVLAGGDKCEVKSEDNCLNIMTIHASKGLEFPYVYLINTETSHSNRDGNSLCLTSKELGLAIKTVDTENKTYLENPLYELLKEVESKKIKEESARLLYVALTRAQEGLYVYASVKESKSNNFYEGNPIMSDTMFGWMSETIHKIGYVTVEGDDVEIVNARNANQIVDISMADDKFVTALKDRFSVMDGIYANGTGQRIKTSVTKIALEGTEEEYPLVDNERARKGNVDPIKKGNVDPIKKGNAYHKTMELLDFSIDFEQAYSKVEKCNISDFKLVDKAKIRHAYECVKPLLDGAKAYKEKSFIYNDGTQLVQGIIDLLIIKDEVATVVDYKTTSLNSLSYEKTIAEYRIQVGIYAEAVRNIIGLKVDKIMLYSFEKNDFIVL